MDMDSDDSEHTFEGQKKSSEAKSRIGESCCDAKQNVVKL